MCGIAGYVNLLANELPSEVTLRNMLGMIRHRGPDEFGIYIDDHVALGNARLSIIDLAGGTQPISNETGELWIVYNGEVFNHVELRVELESRGHVFSTHTDTEVILHLYEEHGAACLNRLNGQFAFALWDTRRRELFLTRDRLGVRPLFYTVHNGRLIFGSEIKAIFAHPGVPRVIAPTGLAQVLRFWSAQAPTTCFQGVHELRPGHWLKVRDGAVRSESYWTLDFDEDTRLASNDDLADQLAQLLLDATRIRLRADVPVGAYLSGGLDSSTIAAVVQQLGHHRLDTFSIAFSDPEFDESEPQRRMAEFLGTQHQVIRASHADIVRVFPDVVWHCETALTRTSPAPMFLLSQLVRQHGYKVVLTGEGADEFLGGYDIFKEDKIRRFWAREPDSRRRPELLRRLYPEIARLGASAPGFVRAFFGAGLFETEAWDYSHRIRWRNTQRARRFFSDDIAREIADPKGTELESMLPAAFSGWRALQRAQYLEVTTFLSSYLLSSQGDRPAMAHAVEGRYPFLDHRMVEFCNRLPASTKLPALREKWLLRKAARRWLPAEIANRRKRPYRAPIHRSFGSTRTPDYAAELMSGSSLRQSGLFNVEAAERLYATVCNGRSLGETDEMALVGILSTELLYHRFVRGFEQHTLHPSDRVKKVDRRSISSCVATESMRREN